MTLQVLQRPNWHGTPLELGDLSRAVIVTRQLGWELWLLVGTQLEAVQTLEQWKAAMGEKGWR
jgi:hypothetical protein